MPTTTACLELHEIINVETLRRRIEEGVDVNRSVGVGRWPLDFAVEHGHLDACRILLEAGADPNRVTESSWDSSNALYVPLWHIFAGLWRKHYDELHAQEVMRVLLAHGASPNGKLPDARYPSPLLVAASEGKYALVDILVDAGANVNGFVPQGGRSKPRQIIERLKDSGPDEMLIKFLRLGADDSSLGRDGSTPFQQCVKDGLDDIVAYYVTERGESLKQKSTGGRTLIQLARKDSTRQLLRSIKTGIVIQNIFAPVGVDGTIIKDATPIAAARKTKGLAAL